MADERDERLSERIAMLAISKAQQAAFNNEAEYREAITTGQLIHAQISQIIANVFYAYATELETGIQELKDQVIDT